MGLTEMPRSRFTNPETLHSLHSSLFWGILLNFRGFWSAYIWEEIVFLKELVTLGEMKNFEDLM